MKSDKSIRNICLASVKRKVSRPFDFTLTQIVDEAPDDYILAVVSLQNSELPISKIVVDKNNWTLITTRRIVTCKDGITNSIDAKDVTRYDWNDFKGYDKTAYTIGKLHLDTKLDFEVFIETGRASLVTIYAIMTLVNQLA